MKYLLFGGSCYYPEGGANDLLGQYESIEAAEQQWLAWINDESWRRPYITRPEDSWAHVAEIREGALTIVSGYRQEHLDHPKMIWKREAR